MIIGSGRRGFACIRSSAFADALRPATEVYRLGGSDILFDCGCAIGSETEIRTPPPRYSTVHGQALDRGDLYRRLAEARLLVSRLDDGPMQETSLGPSVGRRSRAVSDCSALVLLALGRMPAPADALTPFERVAARVTHFSLYASCWFVAPIIGWLGVNAYGEDVSFFGLFKLPRLIAKDEQFSEEIFAVHLACGILIALAVVAHVVAAFVHKVRDDGVMERMLPDL